MRILSHNVCRFRQDACTARRLLPILDPEPLPEIAWTGGRTTLPYQYSDEPKERFKQMATNMAPTGAQPFVLGRRLHHRVSLAIGRDLKVEAI